MNMATIAEPSTGGTSITRREFLQRGAIGTGALILVPTLSGIMAACGSDEPREVLFQLGWVKSVQFGGHFAALENGFFDDLDIVAEFRSGGPTIDPITAVAGGDANFAGSRHKQHHRSSWTRYAHQSDRRLLPEGPLLANEPRPISDRFTRRHGR